MNCFLSIPVQGHRNSDEFYFNLVHELKKVGITIINNCVLFPPKKEEISRYNSREIHADLISKLKQSDCYICDISNPSLGVGYEICKAIEFGKYIYCICEEEKFDYASIMIKGISYAKIKFYKYTSFSELSLILKDGLESDK